MALPGGYAREDTESEAPAEARGRWPARDRRAREAVRSGRPELKATVEVASHTTAQVVARG